MPSRRAILVAAGSAALWLVLAGLHAVLTRVSPPPSLGLGPLGPVRVVVPETLPDFAWASVAPWPVVLPVLAFLLVFCLTAAGAAVVAGAPAASTAARTVGLLWAAVALAGAVALLVLAVGSLLAEPGLRWRLVADRMLGTAPTAVAWALVWAWIPAVIATRATASRAPAPVADRRILITVSAVAVLAAGLLVAAVPAAVAANRATLGQGTPSVLAPAPAQPTEQSVPPPTAAPATAQPDAAWCTPGELTFTDGGGGAATGHRAGAIRATNTGSRTCTLPGYPDLAFADATGNAVEATVTPGGSFMTEDAGPGEVQLVPGAVAVSYAGWDATDGRSSLTSVYVAPWAGAIRSVITVEYAWDLTDASEVFVTAWQAMPASDPFKE